MVNPYKLAIGCLSLGLGFGIFLVFLGSHFNLDFFTYVGYFVLIVGIFASICGIISLISPVRFLGCQGLGMLVTGVILRFSIPWLGALTIAGALMCLVYWREEQDVWNGLNVADWRIFMMWVAATVSTSLEVVYLGYHVAGKGEFFRTRTTSFGTFSMGIWNNFFNDRLVVTVAIIAAIIGMVLFYLHEDMTWLWHK